MATQNKIDAVAALAKDFRESDAAVLTEYRGLKVAEMTTLRRALGADTTYVVVKNTLTKRAVKVAGLTELIDQLQGPTAIAFIRGDVATAAKGLRDFSKDNPLLVIKGGVMDGKSITVDELKRIADLEPREVVLAKLAGAMKGNLTKAVGTFAAPLSKFVRLAAALQEKKPAAAAPAAEATTETAPAVEATIEATPEAESSES